MSVTVHEVRPGAYFDSVVLMQLQRALTELPGVLDAGVVMATPANRELLAASELMPDEVEAKADDLLLVVKAEDEAAATEALSQVDDLLQRRRSGAAQDFRPRSLAAAVKSLPDAGWVLVSVPGRYAAGVAHEALDLGKHVFLYSDNVDLADEVELKRKARDKGLLVMGPDCGTAIINGVGLGFANRVRRGHVGLVAASGTGLQAISSYVHNLGAGVSQAIGTGGRDLKAEVGAVTAQQGLELLSRDPETKVIVLVSKPPAPAVAANLLAAARSLHKPTVVYFIGYPSTIGRLGNWVHFAGNLKEAATQAVDIINVELYPDASLDMPDLDPKRRYVRGLFSGGTLAYEAVLGLQATLAPFYTNVPVGGALPLAEVAHSQAHTVLDMGADEFTQGRLHPMMDNEWRIRRLRQEAGDPEVAIILLDVVLGEGAHPDPAGELAPVIAEVKQERPLEVVAIMIGTDDDPQEMADQAESLTAAGATTFYDTAEAIEYVARCLSRPPEAAYPPVSLAPFQVPLAAVNVGLESFYDSLKSQGAEAIQVDWRPPAGGNERLMALLAKMKQ